MNNYKVYYNDKLVDMGYITDIKKQFKLACMRVHDNNADTGYVLTPKNEIFIITKSSKLAKLVKDGQEKEELLKLFNEETEL